MVKICNWSGRNHHDLLRRFFFALQFPERKIYSHGIQLKKKGIWIPSMTFRQRHFTHQWETIANMRIGIYSFFFFFFFYFCSVHFLFMSHVIPLQLNSIVNAAVCTIEQFRMNVESISRRRKKKDKRKPKLQREKRQSRRDTHIDTYT